MWCKHHKKYTPIKKWYQAVIAWSFRQLIPTNPQTMWVSTKEEDLSRSIVFSQKCCPRWGSNSRPSDYETDALPTALRRHVWVLGESSVPEKMEIWCNFKNLCQKGDSNPRPHKRTRNLHLSLIKGQGISLESGALDHSAILTCLLHWDDLKPKGEWSVPGSNWRPSACKADVITTTPTDQYRNRGENVKNT